MKEYKWIVLKIQDLSTSEYVHSVADDNYSSYEDDVYELSRQPLQYFVPADDFDALFAAKEIMEAALSSIYEVKAVSNEYTTVEDPDGNYEDRLVELRPAYLDNFIYYNARVEAYHNKIAIDKAKKHKKASPGKYEGFKAKKLSKNRFVVVEVFSNSMPEKVRRYNYEE